MSGTLQVGDPQVAWHWEAADGTYQPLRIPGQVFSEVFSALTRDCAFKDKWVCLHPYISLWPRLRSLCHDLWKWLIVNQLFYMRVEPLHTNQGLASGSGSHYLVGPAAGLLLLEQSFKDIEPQRCSMTTGTPRNEEEVTSFSPGVARKLYSTLVGFLGTYLLPLAGAGTSKKTMPSLCFMAVSVSKDCYNYNFQLER